MIAVSGVRRSCETDCSSAVRSRSVSLQRVQQHALVLEPGAPEREPEDAAERLQDADGLLLAATTTGVGGQESEGDPAVADGAG